VLSSGLEDWRTFDTTFTVSIILPMKIILNINWKSKYIGSNMSSLFLPLNASRDYEKSENKLTEINNT